MGNTTIPNGGLGAVIPAKPSKAQQRYSDWLSSNAKQNGVSFGDFLKGGAVDIEPDTTCWTCRGTGEGQTDRTRCYSCGGSGDTARPYGRRIRYFDD